MTFYKLLEVFKWFKGADRTPDVLKYEVFYSASSGYGEHILVNNVEIKQATEVMSEKTMVADYYILIS